MMIEEIKIDKYYWKLYPKVNILGGSNGSGKTWLLQEILKEYSDKMNIILIEDKDLNYDMEIDEDALKLIPNNSRGQQRLNLIFKIIKLKPDVLLIDNIELYLHIDIQRKLLKLLLDISPDTQLIVTTHSPAILLDGWFSNVKEISQILIDSENNEK